MNQPYGYISNNNKQYSSKVKQKIAFDLAVLVTIIYVISVNFIKINIPLVGYLVAVLPLLIMLDYMQCISLLFFYIPISVAIPYHMIYPILLLLYLYKRNKNISIAQGLIPLIIILQEVFLWFTAPEFPATMHMVAYCVDLFFLFFLTKEKIVHHDYDYCIRMYIRGTVFLSLVVFGDSMVSGNFLSVISGNYRLGSSSSISFVNNLNNYAYYIIVAIACIVVVIIENITMHRHSSKEIVALTFLLISGWFMSSRTFTICLLIIVLLALTCLTVQKQIKKRYVFLYIIILLALVVFATNNPQYFAIISDRFKTGNFSDNSRSAILNIYWNWFTNSGIRKFFGTGALTYKTVVFGSNYDSVSLHNGLEQILISYGYIGFFFFVYSLFSCVHTSKNRAKLSFVYYIPLIIVVLFVQTIQFLNPYELMMPFIIACYVIRKGATGRIE